MAVQRRVRVATVCLLALLPISTVRAATIRIPGDVPTIGAGVSIAAPGDTVLIAQGTYYEHDITLPASITVSGETGVAGDVVIDAGELGRVFECLGNGAGLVTLSGLTLTGGRALAHWVPAGLGGAIYCNGSSLRVLDCSFTGNEATMKGGAVIVNGGSECTMVRCRFSSNICHDGLGGAIRWGGASGGATDCTFLSNEADIGGAISTDNSPVALTGCDFLANSADSEGGAACTAGRVVVFSDCTFADNTASVFGGALACYGQGLSDGLWISGCVFTNNDVLYPSSAAGAVFVEGWAGFPVTIEGSDFTDCDANGPCGAMLLSSCDATVSDCSFQRCTASSAGAVGCIGGETSFLECVFALNQASNAGGAIYCTEVSPLVSSCTFADNSAASGAGLRCSEGSTPHLQQTIIAFSESGEAISHDETSCSYLTCCDLYGNADGDWSGCLEAQLGVDGNLSEDPLFCREMNPTAPYTLSSASPCAESVNPACGLIGAQVIGCQATVVESMTWGRLKARFR